MRLKKSKRFEDWMDLKPVTDEEFEELLDEPPRMNRSDKKSRKKIKKELYRDDLNF